MGMAIDNNIYNAELLKDDYTIYCKDHINNRACGVLIAAKNSSFIKAKQFIPVL